MRTFALLLAASLLLSVAMSWYLDPVLVETATQPQPDINRSTQPVADHQLQAASTAPANVLSTQQAKATETQPLPQPADFVQFDGEELVLTLSGLKQLNDAGRIDSFAKALQAEPRSDASLTAERQLTELLQTQVQTFRQSALSRIDCGEYFCLVVAPVQQQDQLFNEFLQHSKTLSFGSGSFYNFHSNGELYNSLILSLKANTSIQ